MIIGAFPKTQAYIAPTVQSTSASATTSFDVGGFDQLAIKVCHPSQGTNASAKWALLEIRLGDSTTYSNNTIVNGLQGTSGTPTSTQFAFATQANTAVANVMDFTIANNRHKYLHVGWQLPATTGYQIPVVIVDQYRSGQVPNTASENGATVVVAAVDHIS
jgi:hypothetical protein